MVPNIAHFVFGLAEQREPFHIVHYLALESCRRVLAPHAIHFHYKHLPYGVYWDLIRPHLTLAEVQLVPEVDGAPQNERLVPARYRYAHHADFLRLDALIEHGGLYLDIDTIVVRPFPDHLFRERFVIGRESPVDDELTGDTRASLCNAVLMAEPQSVFARAWRQEMAAAMNGTWSSHSCLLAHELSERMADSIHIEEQRSFFHYASNPESLTRLLEANETAPAGVFSVHLWQHLWWEPERLDFSPVHGGMLTERFIRDVDTTYNLLARPFLPDLDLW